MSSRHSGSLVRVTFRELPLAAIKGRRSDVCKVRTADDRLSREQNGPQCGPYKDILARSVIQESTMLICIPKRKSFRLPPALLGALAVLIVSVALGQTTPAPSAGPAAPAPAAPAAAPAPADGAAAAAPEDAKPAEDKNLWDLFKAGGIVMYILAGASVIAVAIIFERLYSLRRSQIIPRDFMPGLKAVLRDPRDDAQRRDAVNYCKANDSPIARMVVAFIKRLPRGFEAAEKALEDAGGNEALKLRSNMRMFYSIGSVATLLGLIGTIKGMILAFMNTAKAGDAANKVELLSKGIYEAMVCTFGGLAVAILVTVFYYFFIGRIEKLIGEINDELTQFSDEYGLNAECPEELGVTNALITPPTPGGGVAPAIPMGTAYHRPSVSGA
jgi:biopolymer transport protein ExbB